MYRGHTHEESGRLKVALACLAAWWDVGRTTAAIGRHVRTIDWSRKDDNGYFEFDVLCYCLRESLDSMSSSGFR